MTLGSIQSLTEIGTRYNSCVQSRPVPRAKILTTYHFYVLIIYKFGNLNPLEHYESAVGL